MLFRSPENKDGIENRKQVGFYRENTGRLDKKLLKDFNDVYNDLHLRGYYDCDVKVKVIDRGFKTANNIINRIKPEVIL